MDKFQKAAQSVPRDPLRFMTWWFNDPGTHALKEVMSGADVWRASAAVAERFATLRPHRYVLYPSCFGLPGLTGSVNNVGIAYSVFAPGEPVVGEHGYMTRRIVRMLSHLTSYRFVDVDDVRPLCDLVAAMNLGVEHSDDVKAAWDRAWSGATP